MMLGFFYLFTLLIYNVTFLKAICTVNYRVHERKQKRYKREQTSYAQRCNSKQGFARNLR